MARAVEFKVTLAEVNIGLDTGVEVTCACDFGPIGIGYINFTFEVDFFTPEVVGFAMSFDIEPVVCPTFRDIIGEGKGFNMVIEYLS